jgi:hypothetical protein
MAQSHGSLQLLGKSSLQPGLIHCVQSKAFGICPDGGINGTLHFRHTVNSVQLETPGICPVASQSSRLFPPVPWNIQGIFAVQALVTIALHPSLIHREQFKK